MNEFNPFDELGITFDDDGLQETRRDRSYKNKYNPFDMNKDIKVDLNTEPEYQPDFSQSLTNMNNPKDLQVAQELGIVIPEPMQQEEKQAYVDALSEEDWEIWQNLRDEGYSFEARKAMFDNREDLYDITEPGNKKFWSGNKNWLHEQLIQSAQGMSDFQTDVIHPWSQKAEDWFDLMAQDLSEYSYDEIKQEMYNKVENPNDNNLVKWMRKQAVKPDAIVKREAAIVGSLIFSSLGSLADAFDRLSSSITQLRGVGVNSLNNGKKGYDMVTWDSSKDPSTLLGNYRTVLYDVLGPTFLMKYPLASYILASASSKNETLGMGIEAIMQSPGAFTKAILEDTQLEDYLSKYMTEEEYDKIFSDISMGVWGAIAPKLIKKYGKKIPETKIYKTASFIGEAINEFIKRAWNKGKSDIKKTMRQVEAEPEGTTFENKKGQVLFESTKDGSRITPMGLYTTLRQNITNSLKAGREAGKRAWNNRDKALVTRNPNAPVGELPDIPFMPETPSEGVKPTEEIKSTEEIKEEIPKEEVKTPETGVKTTPKTVTKNVESSENQTIGEYIKKISNEITGKKGGMDQDLFEKFSSSLDLQNEYINTIDPYIKANGGENPAGVIENQLNDFIDTVKDQLQDKRNKNIDFRKGQMKYKVQIPEADRVKWEQENREIKNLIKTLSRTSTDPEKFLNYLLKLPEEKTQGLNKFIPNFSKNLELIKDTLTLTKAITSKDLLGKFLQYKSTWGTRRKNFIRKYLWKKINEAYKRAGIKRNMYEIENMLNKMSEEQLVELEKEIETGKDLPGFVKQDFLDQISWNLEREVWEGAEKNVILPGGTGPEKAWEKLIQQGYKNPKTNTPFKTQEEIENYILPNGRTVKQLLDDMNYTLEHKYSIKPGLQGTADLVERAIEYYGDINKLPEFVIQHEIGHAFLGALTTAEYLDLVEGFSKATKSLKKYEKFKPITEYKSLAKSELGATEFIPDSIGLFLTYMDINGMGDYLQPYLSPALGSKVKKILNDIGKDLWDEFSSVEVNGKKFTPSKEVERLTERGLNDKEFQTRQTNDLDPKYNRGKGYNNRLADWKEIDSNIDFYKWDTDIRSDNFGSMIIKLKDGRSLTWEEYKNTLTPEMKEKLYEDREILDPHNKYRRKKIKGDKQLSEYRSSNDGLSQYKDVIKNIDPNILGLIEKDGQIYVKYLMESQRERYELPDRPGYVEVKEVPAKDYFTEEELNKLPKELKNQILGNEKNNLYL